MSDLVPAYPVPVADRAAPSRPIDAHLLATVALVGSAALWGTSFVAAKPALAEIAPAGLAFLRFAIAAAILLPFACRGGRRPAFGLVPALLGLTGITLFFVLQNAGLRVANAADASVVLGGGLPVLTAVFGAALLGERPNARQLAGLLCSVAGVAVVARAAAPAVGAITPPRNLLLLVGAAGCGAAYGLLGWRAFSGPNFVGVLAGSTLYGAAFLAPAAAAEAAVGGVTAPGPGTWALVLYMGVGCSALAFGLWAFGLRHRTATQSALIGNLELPIGLAAAALALGERLGPGQIAGVALVLLGAVLAVARPPTARGGSV